MQVIHLSALIEESGEAEIKDIADCIIILVLDLKLQMIVCSLLFAIVLCIKLKTVPVDDQRKEFFNNFDDFLIKEGHSYI